MDARALDLNEVQLLFWTLFSQFSQENQNYFSMERNFIKQKCFLEVTQSDGY